MWRLGRDLAVRMQRMDTDPDHQLKEAHRNGGCRTGLKPPASSRQRVM